MMRITDLIKKVLVLMGILTLFAGSMEAGASEYELEFLSLKPEFKIYFGERTSIRCQLYFLPLGDQVLLISAADTPYLGKGKKAQYKMYQLARINAQTQVERFFSVNISGEERSSLHKGKERFSSKIVQQISRDLKMWQVIGCGSFPERKAYCCVIGKIFPAKVFPKSILP